MEKEKKTLQTRKNSSQAHAQAKPRAVTQLRAGDKVYGPNGALLLRVDPMKKQASQARGHAAFMKAIHEAKPAKRKPLEARRKPVVRNDFGLTRRDERIAKRVAQLQKRVGRRRRARRARGARTVRSTNAALDLPPPMDAPQATATLPEPPVEKPADGESFWGGILDSAIELAPHVLPLIAGMGDYSEMSLTDQVLPRTNSIAAAFSDGEMCSEVPAIHNLGSETRFTHREYIGDVYASEAAFTTLEFDINPGMNETFPWASRSAVNYEQYSLLGAMMCFETESSNASSPLAQGFVALGSQYDVAETSFLSKKEMFQSLFSVARRPSESFAHWIECNPEILVLPKKFIRSGTLPSGLDPHLYDHCRTTLAVGGQPTGSANSIIGELWITYDFLVTLPRSDETTAHSVLYTAVTSTGGAAVATPLGTSWSQDAANTFEFSLTGTTLTFPQNFPAGDYDFWVEWGGSTAGGGVTSANPAVSISGSGNTIVALDGAGLGAVVSAFALRYRIHLTGVGTPVITFASAGLAGLAAGTITTKVWCNQVPQPFIGRQSQIFDWGGKHQTARYDAQRSAEAGVTHKTRPDASGSLIVRTTARCALLVDSTMQFTVAVPEADQTPVVVPDAQARWLLTLDDPAFDKTVIGICARG